MGEWQTIKNSLATMVWLENTKVTYYLGDLAVDGRIMLKSAPDKYVKIWTGLKWFSNVFYIISNTNLSSIKTSVLSTIVTYSGCRTRRPNAANTKVNPTTGHDPEPVLSAPSVGGFGLVTKSAIFCEDPIHVSLDLASVHTGENLFYFPF